MTKKLLAIGYLALLVLPGYFFFQARSFDFLRDISNLRAALGQLFPLFGLYAFTLVAIQALIGSNMPLLKPHFPKIRHFHQLEGLFALAFILIHPTMILAAYGLSSYLHRDFVPDNLKIYVWFAQAGLIILLATITTAFLAWRGVNIGWWRRIHRFNYLAFVLVWIHSWFIGSDVQTSSLKYLWIFYLLAVSVSVLNRYVLPQLKVRN